MNIYKRLSIATIGLFLFGILYTVVYLFNLPEQFSSALPALAGKLNSINGVMYRIYLVVGIELALGVGSIILLILSNQGFDNVNIVYVDKYTTTKKDEADNEEKRENSLNIQDHLAEIEAKVKSIKSMLGGRGDAKKKLDKALSAICNEIEASQGAIFLSAHNEDKRVVRLHSSFAYSVAESALIEYEYGEGLTGQAAKEGKIMKVDTVPDGYIKIFSGLGNASPTNLILLPLKKEEDVIGVIEISSFKLFGQIEEEYLKRFSFIVTEFVGNQKDLVTENS